MVPITHLTPSQRPWEPQPMTSLCTGGLLDLRGSCSWEGVLGLFPMPSVGQTFPECVRVRGAGRLRGTELERAGRGAATQQ